MSHTETVSLSKVRPNPHRDLDTYPWIEDKLAQLMRSIEDVGFWAGIIGRQADDGYELAFGHHRVEAARRLGMAEVPLIVEDLDDQRMLQFMGRENGEDYSADFLVMLNTWEGAVNFIANSRKKARSDATASKTPLRTAALLGWTSLHVDGGQRMKDVATACSAAYALIKGGYMSRSDLVGLSIRDARDVVVRSQERVEQLEKIGRREGRDPKQTRQAQDMIGKAARITARDTREGRIAARDIRSSVDLNAMRVAGTEKERLAPLFSVFGQSLCDSVARMLNTDSAAERINEIGKALGSIEQEEDHTILRKLHHELDELAHRTQRAKRRTTPNKVVPLKAIEQGA
jgi:hypothetical protein